MRCVAEIRDACSDWGFFQVVNHGVDKDLLARFHEAQMGFFALDKAEKGQVRRTESNSKGWYDDELTKNKVDWKEGFDFGTQDGSLDIPGLDGHNQWPQRPEAFEPVMREYFVSCETLARKLTCCMALGLSLEAEHFAAEFDSCHSSYLRLNYYPRCPDPSSHMAISHHSDAGAVTVLSQGPLQVQSLQVLQPADGLWYDVEPIEGAYTINTGDIMQVWSNDLYKAPLHRVKAQLTDERYSSPFFYNPSYKTNYAPVHTTVTQESPARYREINWGKFRLGRFAGDYANVGEEVQISHFRI